MTYEESEQTHKNWTRSLTLLELQKKFLYSNCEMVLIKHLEPNDNTKNQIYVGPDLKSLSLIPIEKITLNDATSKKPKAEGKTFHAGLKFYWLNQSEASRAPKAKLIFYPQYPEVRLSGLLSGCRQAPNYLLSKEKRGTEKGRILLLGIAKSSNSIYGSIFSHDAPSAPKV